jgi:hypothetical protein
LLLPVVPHSAAPFAAVAGARRCAPWAALLLLLSVVPGVSVAQGTLSGQGFGYPLGGLSTRAVASGGAGAEFDGFSARNPAAIALGYRTGLHFQYDPEFRQVDQGTQRDRTVTPRFAALGVVFPVRTRGAIGLSTHSLLDRTWATQIRSGQRLGSDSVEYTETNRSSGALNETRLSVGFAPLDGKIAIGGAFHLVTGENRLTLRREFDDSLRYGTLLRTLTLAYSGTGVSGGVIVRPVSWFSLAASARQGGTISLRVVDTLRTRAKVPNRMGFAARLDAIPGVSLLGSADKVSWSRMNGLGSTQADAQDAWEYAVGADFSATRSRRGASWVYSAGYRTRDLPFSALGAPVSERLLTGGLSAPVSGGRATMDLAVQRATREAAGSTSERAWLVSVGLTVRP